ncbi:MAG TPA: MarR family transcriptional regulator [Stellaceae bacterium]|nr:MarR family transcriptional regulator [Stellaceae bacterium]
MARNDASPLTLSQAAVEPFDDAALRPGIGFLVNDVSRLLRRHFERRARQTGLPITRLQAAAILYIARHEGVSQAAVASQLDIEPIALVRMLDRLHEEGLVERRPHPTDRRIRTLWLTPLARPVVERILAINRSIRAEAYAGLPPAQRDALLAALEQIKGNLAAAEEDGAAAELPARPRKSAVF